MTEPTFCFSCMFLERRLWCLTFWGKESQKPIWRSDPQLLSGECTFHPSSLHTVFLWSPGLVWIEFVYWIILYFLEFKSFGKYELSPYLVLESRDERWSRTRERRRALWCPFRFFSHLLGPLLGQLFLSRPLSCPTLHSLRKAFFSRRLALLISFHIRSALLLLQSIYHLTYSRIYLPHCSFIICSLW